MSAADAKRPTPLNRGGRGAPAQRGVESEHQLSGTRDIALLFGLWRYIRPYKGLFWVSMGLLPAIAAVVVGGFAPVVGAGEAPTCQATLRPPDICELVQRPCHSQAVNN